MKRLHPPLSHAAGSDQRGMSLVELLVAMAIGLALLSALVTIYVNGNRSNLEMERSVRQLDNGRFAMEVIGEDLNMAGYYGDVVVQDLNFVAPDPAVPGQIETEVCSVNNLRWDVATRTAPVAIIGLTPAQAAAAACLERHRPGTPALVIRRVATERELVTAINLPGQPRRPYIQTSRCEQDLVTTPFVVSAAGGFVLRDLNCTDINRVQRFVVRIYYVSDCNECANDNTPTLKVAELNDVGAGAALPFLNSPLAEGVEDLALEFGFDNDNNGSADVFDLGLNAATGANEWSNVVAARVFLLTRTTEETPGYTSDRTFNLGLAGERASPNDSFKRRVYVMTNRLNNVSGPRETP